MSRHGVKLAVFAASVAMLAGLGACSRSNSSTAASAEEANTAPVQVANTLTFGVEGMRRINGAL